MSFLTLKSSLDTALKLLGYKQNALNLSLEEKFNNKHWNIDVEVATEAQISNVVIGVYQVTINMGFIVNSNEDFDQSIDAFVTAATAIKNLSEFAGFTTNATVRRLEGDNKKIIITQGFNYGRFSCN